VASSTGQWPQVSDRVRELIRQAAQIAVHPPAEWADALNTAVFDGPGMRDIAADPVLRSGTLRANIVNTRHWVRANIDNPGARVRTNVTAEEIEFARDVTRRGFGERALDSYRTASNVAWRYWMSVCFQLTTDAGELRELLDTSALSMSTYTDDMIATIGARVQAALADRSGGSYADRQAIELIMKGTPSGYSRVQKQLGYSLTGPHVATVIWGGVHTATAALTEAAEHLAEFAGVTRKLVVFGGPRTLWIWLPAQQFDAVAPLRQALLPVPDIRVAVGRPGTGVDGFRNSHRDALSTQQILAGLNSPQQVARFEDVQLVAALTGSATQVGEFVDDTLGDLAGADHELRETLLVFLQEQGSTSRTAERIYAHRNTVLRRVERAQTLLPRPLASNVIAVAAALEVVRWRGPNASAAS